MERASPASHQRPPNMPDDMALHRGSLARHRADHMLAERAFEPFNACSSSVPETLGLMLFGMAGFKRGFLTGEWERPALSAHCRSSTSPSAHCRLRIVVAYRHRRSISTCRWLFGDFVVGHAPFRILMALGYAALIILLSRNSRLASRPLRGGRPRRLHQLSRHQHRSRPSSSTAGGLGLLRPCCRAGRPGCSCPWSGLSCCSGRSRGSTASTTARSNGLWRSLSRGAAAADAEGAAGSRCRPRSGRIPGWRPCVPNPPAPARGLQRIGRLVEQLDRPVPQPAKLDDFGDQLIGEAVGFDAEARGLLDQLGDRRQRLGAELARLRPSAYAPG